MVCYVRDFKQTSFKKTIHSKSTQPSGTQLLQVESQSKDTTMQNLEIATLGELSDMYHATLWGVTTKFFLLCLWSDFLFPPPLLWLLKERRLFFTFFFFFLNTGKGNASSLMCYKLLKGRQHFKSLPPFYICGEKEESCQSTEAHAQHSYTVIRYHGIVSHGCQVPEAEKYLRSFSQCWLQDC